MAKEGFVVLNVCVQKCVFWCLLYDLQSGFINVISLIFVISLLQLMSSEDFGSK